MKQGVSASVAIFVYNYSTSGAAYSGGRYHALLLAYAMAHAGIRVRVIVDSYPAARTDLEGITTYPVEYILTKDFKPAEISGEFDFVFVAPSGAFHP